MSDRLIAGLRELLEGKLPGREAQFSMAPELRLENQFDNYRNAAVLILLYPANGELYFVLMKRPEYIGAHSNQISLPGGMHEESDPDLGATALREAREETGVDTGRIELLGSLSRLEIPVSGYEVTPFVGYFPEKPVFICDPSEVAYLIEVPLGELLSEENVKKETRTVLSRVMRVPYFSLQGEKVWGATAMILSEFLELIKKVEG